MVRTLDHLTGGGRAGQASTSPPQRAVSRIVLASSVGSETAAFRYRLGLIGDAGDAPFTTLAVGSFPGRPEVESILREADTNATLVLARALPTDGDLRRLRNAYDRLIFDFDDAIYAVPPALSESSSAKAVKRAARLLLRGSRNASSRRRPLIRALRAVDVAVAGNEVLAEFAKRYATRVEVIPTTIQPVASPFGSPPDTPVLVWVGLPSNLQHLALIREALLRLRATREFRLRIISSSPWEDAELPSEFVPWSEQSMRAALLASSVGLAPLVDDDWTRGKCALRAIQYGGHGLPTVAHPVGVTSRVVLDNHTGLLARSEGDWLAAIDTLLADPGRARRMGRAALDHVTANYSNDVAKARWRRVLYERPPASD
jgi:glycosyltransferase involved in cell wall biosynthesis